MSRALYFNFIGYSGFDLWLSILPKPWQTKRVARAWLQMMTSPNGEAPNPRVTPMIVQMPWGSYRIVDYSGNVEPCAKEHFKF